MMQLKKVTFDGGTKFDAGKMRIDLITPEMIKALSAVLAYGAGKYGERNFEKGLRFSRLWAATQRHLWSYWQGEDMDEESGKPHLWHAMTSLGMLITLKEREFPDDRPLKMKGE